MPSAEPPSAVADLAALQVALTPAPATTVYMLLYHPSDYARMMAWIKEHTSATQCFKPVGSPFVERGKVIRMATS